MGASPSDGILAVWREGEVRGASVLPVATQEMLGLLGATTVRSLAAGLFEAPQGHTVPEWRTPREEYLASSAIAWRLGVLSAQHPNLHLRVLVYRGRSQQQAFELQAQLNTGYRELVDCSRGLAAIENAREEAALEAARKLSMGQLHVLPVNLDTIADFALAEIAADPTPEIGAEIIPLLNPAGMRSRPAEAA